MAVLREKRPLLANGCRAGKLPRYPRATGPSGPGRPYSEPGNRWPILSRFVSKYFSLCLLDLI